MLRRNLVISVVFSLILLVSSILPQRLLFRPTQARASDIPVNELTGPGSVQDDSWSSTGPAGGYGACLAISTSDPDVLYACSYGGVYRSTDSGVNWTRTTIHSTIYALQVAPNDSQIVYAGTPDGVYKTLDGGGVWTKIGLAGAQVNALAIQPGDPLTVYAGTGVSSQSSTEIIGIFMSDDGGATWQQTLTREIIPGVAEINDVKTILIDPSNPQRIYAGVGSFALSFDDFSVIFRSTDGGLTWTNLDMAEDIAIFSLAITPPGHIPAAVYAAASLNTIYKSNDDGDTWQKLPTPPDEYLWETIALDPNAPNQLYVRGNGKEMFITPNDGLAWTKLTLDFSPVEFLFDPRDSQLFASSHGVFRSSDGGATWQDAYYIDTYINDLAIDPLNPGSVYAAVDGGFNLATSSDGGSAWDYRINSKTDLGAVAVDPQNPATVYAGMGWKQTNWIYIYKSTNYGQDWSNILIRTCNAPSVCRTAVSKIVVHPQNSNYLLVGTTNADGLLQRSKNGGSSWETVGTSTTALAADPQHPEIVYKGSADLGYVTRYADVWGGFSGSPSDITPAGGIGNVHDIVVDNAGQPYVAASDGLWRWDGVNWHHFNNLPPVEALSLAVDLATNPGDIYVGLRGYGVWWSQDGGTNWTAINTGLEVPYVLALEISLTQPKLLYAGTEYGGVWSRLAPSSGPAWKLLYLPITLR